MCEIIPKTKNTNKKKGGNSLRTFYEIAALLHIRQEMKKVYRQEDIKMACQIALAIWVICFLASRF